MLCLKDFKIHVNNCTLHVLLLRTLLRTYWRFFLFVIMYYYREKNLVEIKQSVILRYENDPLMKKEYTPIGYIRYLLLQRELIWVLHNESDIYQLFEKWNEDVPQEKRNYFHEFCTKLSITVQRLNLFYILSFDLTEIPTYVQNFYYLKPITVYSLKVL